MYRKNKKPLLYLIGIFYLPFTYFVNIFFSRNFVCRLTFKVTDVLTARISETAGFAGLAKCGGVKPHEGAKRRLRFFGARTAEQAVSSYRLLGEVELFVYYHDLMLKLILHVSKGCTVDVV